MDGNLPKIDDDGCTRREQNFVPEQPIGNWREFVVSPITEIRERADREKLHFARMVQLNSVDVFVLQRVAVLVDPVRENKQSDNQLPTIGDASRRFALCIADSVTDFHPSEGAIV